MHGSCQTVTEDLIEGGSGKPLKAPVVTLIFSALCFQKLIHTSSRGLSLPPMIPHAKEISDISTAKWKELKGWFWDDFITCFPPRPAPRSLLSKRIYPDFALIQLKMGAEVLSLPNMFLQRQKKASRQIKAKKILNLLITQLNCAVTDRGNEHIFIRALWYEWGVKRETQRGNQEQLQGDGEWIKCRLLSLNGIPACTSPNIFLWEDWGPACRHVIKGRNHKRSCELYNLTSQIMNSNIPDLKKCPFAVENFKNNQVSKG